MATQAITRRAVQAIVVQSFQFGSRRYPAKAVVLRDDYDEWPDGMFQRRVENGFIMFGEATPEEIAEAREVFDAHRRGVPIINPAAAAPSATAGFVADVNDPSAPSEPDPGDPARVALDEEHIVVKLGANRYVVMSDKGEPLSEEFADRQAASNKGAALIAERMLSA